MSVQKTRPRHALSWTQCVAWTRCQWRPLATRPLSHRAYSGRLVGASAGRRDRDGHHGRGPRFRHGGRMGVWSKVVPGSRCCGADSRWQPMDERRGRWRFVPTLGDGMGWLGLDDTDSLAGGCTTAVFHALLDGLPDHVRYDDPRLVRLWPFAESNHPQAPAWCGLSNNRHTRFTSVPFAPTWSLVMYPNPTVLGGNTGASGRRRRWLGRPRSPRGRPSHGDHHRPPINLGGLTGMRLRQLTAGLIPFCHATPATARVSSHHAGALRSCLVFVRPPKLRLRKVVDIFWLRAAPNLLPDGESSGPIRPAAITSMNRIG